VIGATRLRNVRYKKAAWRRLANFESKMRKEKKRIEHDVGVIPPSRFNFIRGPKASTKTFRFAMTRTLDAEIGLAHVLIVEEVGRVARHAHAAEIQNDATVGERQSPGGILLRQQHGEAFGFLDFA
jgi:hypothetical protein